MFSSQAPRRIFSFHPDLPPLPPQALSFPFHPATARSDDYCSFPPAFISSSFFERDYRTQRLPSIFTLFCGVSYILGPSFPPPAEALFLLLWFTDSWRWSSMTRIHLCLRSRLGGFNRPTQGYNIFFLSRAQRTAPIDAEFCLDFSPPRFPPSQLTLANSLSVLFSFVKVCVH